MNDLSLSAGYFNGLGCLAQLDYLRLLNNSKGHHCSRVVAAPDLTLERFTALLARLGPRFLYLENCVPSLWLSAKTTLSLYGRFCPLLQTLVLASNYSLDLLVGTRGLDSHDVETSISGTGINLSDGRQPPVVFHRLIVIRVWGCILSQLLNHLCSLPHNSWGKSQHILR